MSEPIDKNDTQDFNSKQNYLWIEINNLLDKSTIYELSVSAQAHLGKLFNLLEPIKIYETGAAEEFKKLLVLQLLKSSLQAILLPTPNLIVATEARRELRDIVRDRGWAIRNFHSCQPSLKVMWGLLTGLLIILVGKWLLEISLTPIRGIVLEHLRLATYFGAIGSAVSIMIRFKDFYLDRDGTTSFYFLTGCYKPIIGVFFALFVYASMMWGIIPIKIEQGQMIYVVMVISFLAGFSERFAQDIADNAEKLNGKNKAI